MAITIRNKTTEELIRKIGRRTGEGPSAVILRLARAEVLGQPAGTVSEEEVQRRIARFDELAAQFPYTGPKLSWEEVEDEMDSIFGDDLK